MLAESVRSGDAATRLVASCLVAPARSQMLTLADWGVLLRLLRRNGMLATFAEALSDMRLMEKAPEKARLQMTRARIAAQSGSTAVRFEVNRMLRALKDYDGPLVLLKGAAYELAGLPPAIGRVTGDVDVMVPRARIDEVERMLCTGGWRLATTDAYDERYYREWSHEIPPLIHPHRETPIDLHHTIAPVAGRARPDAAALFAMARVVPGGRLQILAPADMVLHSALHLFNDEVTRPLRDLFDIHVLLRHFGGTPDFWQSLVERAAVHGVERPLYYMLAMVHEIFGIEIPEKVAIRATSRAPNVLLRHCMSHLFRLRFSADFVSSGQVRHRLAKRALYVRAHWLRMSPLLLAGHLARKSAHRIQRRFARGSRRNVVGAH
jgi:hypothetical protein